jgi:uncharacterized protein (TIGR00266 family)
LDYKIRYKPTFATIFITLEPRERIVAEAGAVVSMDSNLSMTTEFAGGILQGLLRKFFGGESMFVNTFTNNSDRPLQLVLTQSVIGDIESINLGDLPQKKICFQPGAYIANTSGVSLGVRWAGFASWLAGEGLFKLELSGRGQVFFGGYGGLSAKRVTGEFVVDSGHLVAYEPGISMKIGLAGGGLVSSVTSGEGLINKLSGEGLIYLQSRSVSGLVRFLRPKIR